MVAPARSPHCHLGFETLHAKSRGRTEAGSPGTVYDNMMRLAIAKSSCTK
jgi:hypothetical protein